MLKPTSKSRSSSPTRSVYSTPRTPLERNLSSYGFPSQHQSGSATNNNAGSSYNSNNNSRRTSVSSTASNLAHDQSGSNNNSRRISFTPSVNGNPTLRIQILNYFDLRFSYASILQSVSVVISVWSIWAKGFALLPTLVGVLSSSTFNARARAEHLGLRKVSLLLTFLLFLSVALHSMFLGDDSRSDLASSEGRPQLLEVKSSRHLSLKQKLMRKISTKINRRKISNHIQEHSESETVIHEEGRDALEDHNRERRRQDGKDLVLEFDLVSNRENLETKQVRMKIPTDFQSEESKDQLDRRKIEKALQSMLFPHVSFSGSPGIKKASSLDSIYGSDDRQSNEFGWSSASLLCKALGAEDEAPFIQSVPRVSFKGHVEIKIRGEKERIFIFCEEEDDAEDEFESIVP